MIFFLISIVAIIVICVIVGYGALELRKDRKELEKKRLELQIKQDSQTPF